MYGAEHEIFVHSYIKQSKSHNLVAEQEGKTTVDIPLRRQLENNSWIIVSAKTPNEDFDERELDRPITIQDVLRSLHDMAVQRGYLSIVQLRNMFVKVDHQGGRQRVNHSWSS